MSLREEVQKGGEGRPRKQLITLTCWPQGEQAVDRVYLQGVEVEEGGPYAFIKASHHIGGRVRLHSSVKPQPDGCHIHCGQPAHPRKLLYAHHCMLAHRGTVHLPQHVTGQLDQTDSAWSAVNAVG